MALVFAGCERDFVGLGRLRNGHICRVGTRFGTEIGKQIGVSQMQVSRLIRQALAKLTDAAAT